MFGFSYIPPNDSQYYSHEAFAVIQEKVKYKHTCNGYLITGDMNARFGTTLREILSLIERLNTEEYSYLKIKDDVAVANENAKLLSSICIDMLVMNDLKSGDKHFAGNKTYQKGDVWISELDLCVVSPRILDVVSYIFVMQRTDLLLITPL